MIQSTSSDPVAPTADITMPIIRLEVRSGSKRVNTYEVPDGGFLIGSVAGCDLRLPANNQAPVICLFSPHPQGAQVRRLAPTQQIHVNGQPVASALLGDGDCVRIGGIEVGVRIEGCTTLISQGDSHDQGRIQEEIDQLRQAAETARAEWEGKLQELEEARAELDVQRQELETAFNEVTRSNADLEEREKILHHERTQLVSELEEARSQRDAFAKRAGQIANVEQRLSQREKDLQQRLRERRDRLIGYHHSLRRINKKLKLRRQELDTRQQELLARDGASADRERQLREHHAQLDELHGHIEEEKRALAGERADLIRTREANEQDRLELDQSRKQHREDLVRLDRWQAQLDLRQKQIDEQSRELEGRMEQLQRDSHDLEEQAASLDEWHQRRRQEQEFLDEQKKEQQKLATELTGRAATLEGQQAMLTTLRTRLERMREDLRKEEALLSEQRVLQESTESELRQREQESLRLKEELDNERQVFAAERTRFEEQSATMQRAVAQMREARERLDQEEADLRERRQLLDAGSADLVERTGLLNARAEQLAQEQQQLHADREALDKQQEALNRSESTVAVLQEQLRRRNDDLQEKERQLNEMKTRIEQDQGSCAAQHQQLEEVETQLQARRAELDRREQALVEQEQKTEEEQQERLSLLQEGREKLEQAKASIAQQQQDLAVEKTHWESIRTQQEEELAKLRQGVSDLQEQALSVVGQLPELAGRAEGCLQRLLGAREQLREALAEIHGYARQSRDDLVQVRALVVQESERVRGEEEQLQAARDEYRLAVAAFRQQVIEWQGRIGELKDTLVRSESSLERRRAEILEQENRLATAGAQLAEEARRLDEQKRLVAQKRGQLDRHLIDMQEWYRRKLREVVSDGGSEAEIQEGSEPAVLSMLGDLEPGDRRLGDLLQSLELVDAETLHALLLQARRQRRSLRQLLLAGNYLTLFQLALIEAGNLEGLAMGPVRVIDRVHAGPAELRYRVFDPRRSQEALFRHLSEEMADDPVRPDEFRQRFNALAAVKHPHVASTYEVFELAGRPAVLQEWLTGVPSNDWPSAVLAGAPGVLYRLLSQAALSLQTIHEAGIIHGRLEPGSFLLTSTGLIKLVGAGEPSWLVDREPDENASEPSVEADLAALGTVVRLWLTAALKRGKKTRQLPEGFFTVLERLVSDDAAIRFTSASEVLQVLDEAGADVPPNATAWERFVQQARELHAQEKSRHTA